MNRTRIDWADFTWNPAVGCTGGCPYCYAKRMAHRFHRNFTPHWEEDNFQRAMPRNPSRIFVNSMSDLADWKVSWRECVNDVVRRNPQHLFLYLTKRPRDCVAWWNKSIPNAMLGVSVTNANSVLGVVDFLSMGQIHFLSIEPLHGDMDLGRLTKVQTSGIRWIIVGAETGNRKGKVVPNPKWVTDIDRYAQRHGIPIFFKESLRSVMAGSGYGFPQEFPARRGA